ncbi:MAG: hypothetical protein A3E87_00665 [Gammaproteobacteria bacterium RIFCSPHIGHO2_12_FULL_35_23]|nr:MAG: hypothetical protein A3E87_00665 [Gammaproteobacteria bacterium RIFCSPHIGHO2_12_FULL_35_23]
MTTTQEANKKDTEVRKQSLSSEKRSEASKEAAAIIKEHAPQAINKTGQKDSSRSQGSKADDKE